MENLKNINSITSKIEAVSKRYFYAFLLFFGAFTAFTMIIFSIVYCQGKTENDIAKLIMYILIGPAITMTFFLIATNVKTNNYFLTRWFLLIYRRAKKIYSSQHFLKVFLRAMFSFLFWGAMIFIGLIPIQLDKELTLPASSTGLILIYYSIVFLILYGVIALPRFIGLKTNKNEHAYFYWLQFYKSLMSGSPIFLFLSFVFYIIGSVMLIFLTIVVYREDQGFSFNLLLDNTNFGLLISVLGIWLAVVIAMANDFLLNYTRLDKCYEKHTSYTLKKHILDGEKFEFILVGMGNLGKIAAGFIIPEIINKQVKFLKKPMAYFECIIDRGYELRIFPRNIVAIEINQSLFEETRVDLSSGLSYGFISGKDFISEMGDKQRLPSNIALFTLNGDGGYLPMLKLANYESSRLIINTSSDHDMGLKLKMLIDREKKSIEDKKLKETETTKKPEPLEEVDYTKLPPVIITTVDDSSFYSYLEDNNEISVFPIHAGLIEGNAVGSRLFMIIMNLIENGVESSNIRLFILGNGKTLYHTINTLHKLMLLKFSLADVKKFFTNSIIVVSDDPILDNEIIPINDTYPNRYTWKIHLNKEITYDFKLIRNDPANYYAIQNSFKWMQIENYPKSINIITFSVKNSNNVIRICEHIRQISSEYKLEEMGILASVPIEMESEVKKILKEFNPLKVFLKKYLGFPFLIKDIIIKKNLVIGSQIISISDSLKHETTDPKKDKHLFKNPGKIISGEISFCLEDSPGSFLNLMTQLSGFNLNYLPDQSFSCLDSRNSQLIPSFFNNYTFSLRLPDNISDNLFVFRGDVFLKNTTEDLDRNAVLDYSINGHSHFKTELENILPATIKKKYNKQKECGYTTKCPVSSDCIKIYKSNTLEDLRSPATIKILADFDDTNGSLAVMIADFLMVGKDMSFNSEKIKGDTLDIIYEYCNTCDYSGNSINRLYVNIQKSNHLKIKKKIHQLEAKVFTFLRIKKLNRQVINETDKKIEKIETLLKKRNIIAIKIKPAKQSDNNWDIYSDNLIQYLNSFNGNQFIRKQDNSDIIIYKEMNEKLYKYVRTEL